MRNFEIIGEPTKHIPAEIKQQNPLIRWKDIAVIQDKLADEYFWINLK